jgi:hypothetical protein
MFTSCFCGNDSNPWPVLFNGKTVKLEAFYFSGFEIMAIVDSLGPSSSGEWRIVPTGTLIWVEGGISQELQSKLYTQTTTSSGYPEHFGKLRITGILFADLHCLSREPAPQQVFERECEIRSVN